MMCVTHERGTMRTIYLSLVCDSRERDDAYNIFESCV